MNQRQFMNVVTFWVLVIFIFSIVALFVGASLVKSNDRRNASLCIDQGGIYIRTASGEYDCVGETPSMTRTR